jgi:sporulation protein YlmC with PRC-barrel domain
MRSERTHMLSASSLMGDGVRNSKGEDLGTIKDIVLDLDGGNVVYAVLSFGGFLGLGDKLFAIPWDSLDIDMHNRVLVLDVPRDQLENAPGFDRENWPEQPDDEFIDSVYTHYGHEPYSSRRSKSREFAGADTQQRTGGRTISGTDEGTRNRPVSGTDPIGHERRSGADVSTGRISGTDADRGIDSGSRTSEGGRLSGGINDPKQKL